jgi:uncharacterized protein
MTRRVAGLSTLQRAVATALAVLLGACSSAAPPRFHTLMPAPASSTAKIGPTGSLAWEVLAVSVPAQVDQPQWVVRTADGSLAVLEQERWIAPLGEEIRAAVAERLTQIVGVPAPVAPGEQRNRWRVRIEVQRFDSAPGREARLEATWTVRSDAEGAASVSCRGEFVQSLASGGYPALAQGHQQAVAKLAGAIGSALKALSAGQPAACVG